LKADFAGGKGGPGRGSQIKMKIFLSYSSKDRPKAEEIALALQAQGTTFSSTKTTYPEAKTSTQ
jgi:hypothetical protein